jgi:DNA-directed RNA polymerase
MDITTQSEALTLQKFNDKQDRVARNFGYGDTVGAMGVARANLKKLSTAISQYLTDARQLPTNSERGQFCKLIENLDTDVVALCALSGTLGGIARDGKVRSVCLSLGQSIAAECFARDLLLSDKALATRINKVVKNKHGNLKYRKQAARSLASRSGFKQQLWSVRQYLVAGNTLLDWVVETLPDVFAIERDGEEHAYVTIAPGALEQAEAAVEAVIQRNPVFLPCIEPPKPWTGWTEGGYWDKRSRFKASAVRTYHKDAQAAVRASIRDGSMSEHLTGLNALQAVPWKINRPILDLIRQCEELGLAVSGIPGKDPLPMPTKPRAWEDMTDDERRLWRHKASKIVNHNRTQTGNRVLFAQDMATADMLADAERFYTPMNCDWRGRVYGVTHFNFQRDDRVRALFLFANGEPLGEDGLYWLKVHTANCGDFDKISKQPFDDRVAWVDKNLSRITECSNHPLSATAKSFWTEADKPFLFIAACKELDAALRSQNPKNFTTHLPVSFDGSCSGLQHLCAMTRAPEGSLVNLTPSLSPQDVYQTVATVVEKSVQENASGENLSPQRFTKDGKPTGLSPEDQVELAKLCLKFGITRKVVKRNVMTYSYSSKKYGMAKQQDEDLIEPLTFDVLSGKITEHPFGRFADKPHENAISPAALYLAEKTYAAIQSTVNLPEQAMVFLQKCAKALAHEGKVLTWRTPTGLPWANIYRTPKVKRVELWLHDTRLTISIADGTTATVDKDRAANGVAPNFVHSLDAAHLMLTVNAAASEGITDIATVHDSFGCLASRAGRFREIIREQFVKMYEDHDVLSEVLASAKHDLTVHNWQRLPDGLKYGSLHLQNVLNASYAFA